MPHRCDVFIGSTKLLNDWPVENVEEDGFAPIIAGIWLTKMLCVGFVSCGTDVTPDNKNKSILNCLMPQHDGLNWNISKRVPIKGANVNDDDDGIDVSGFCWIFDEDTLNGEFPLEINTLFTFDEAETSTESEIVFADAGGLTEW